jgi:hypothetical protein
MRRPRRTLFEWCDYHDIPRIIPTLVLAFGGYLVTMALALLVSNWMRGLPWWR